MPVQPRAAMLFICELRPGEVPEQRGGGQPGAAPEGRGGRVGRQVQLQLVLRGHQPPQVGVQPLPEARALGCAACGGMHAQPLGVDLLAGSSMASAYPRSAG